MWGKLWVRISIYIHIFRGGGEGMPDGLQYFKSSIWVPCRVRREKREMVEILGLTSSLLNAMLSFCGKPFSPDGGFERRRRGRRKRKKVLQ